MKWSKHHSNLRNHEAVARFLDSAGLEGYGFFCMVKEMIAESMEPGDQQCELCLSLRRWSITLGIHRNKVAKYASTLGGTGLAIVTREGSDLRVQMPILAEWRDEYSKKSGHAHERVRTDSSKITSEKEKYHRKEEGGMGGEEFVSTNGGKRDKSRSTGLKPISELLPQSEQEILKRFPHLAEVGP